MKVLGYAIMLLLIVAGVSSYVLSLPIHNAVLDTEMMERMQVAPRDQAVTLARTLEGDILLVVDLNVEGVMAVDVESASGGTFEDSLAAYQALGSDGLRALLDGPVSKVDWANLDSPVADHSPHIAVGTNYRAHAEEVGLEGDPFLFPKMSQLTPWNAEVNSGARLDYEVELCAIPLTDHSEENPARLGYLLCGDFTDRWILVRDLDLKGEMGRTGFPTGKSGDTRLPIGALLVIPDDEDFYRRIDLSLYVNGQMRQQANAGAMIWSPAESLSRAQADCKTDYVFGNRLVHIASCDHIPAGKLILTGTPDGVLFHLATLWSPWAYLASGDEVVGLGTYLGYTSNRIR